MEKNNPYRGAFPIREIDFELASKNLTYDPETGVIARRISSGGRRAGDIYSKPNKHGYIKVSLGGKSYQGHRVAWCLHYGSISTDLVIDHINRIRTDNRICNLRLVDQAGNANNKSYQFGRDRPKCYEILPNGKCRLVHRGVHYGRVASVQEAEEEILKILSGERRPVVRDESKFKNYMKAAEGHYKVTVKRVYYGAVATEEEAIEAVRLIKSGQLKPWRNIGARCRKPFDATRDDVRARDGEV